MNQKTARQIFFISTLLLGWRPLIVGWTALPLQVSWPAAKQQWCCRRPFCPIMEKCLAFEFDWTLWCLLSGTLPWVAAVSRNMTAMQAFGIGRRSACGSSNWVVSYTIIVIKSY